jgi:hypothetical protein
MDPAIFAARLQENMIAIISPSRCERGRNDRPSMALTPKLGMRDNVFEKSVSPATTQEIGCGDERAGRNDPTVHSRYEDCKALLLQHLRPNLLGSLCWLRASTDFRDAVEFEQRGKVGRLGKSGIGH